MKDIFLTVCSIVIALVCAEIGLRMLGIGTPTVFAPHLQLDYLMKQCCPNVEENTNLYLVSDRFD